MTTIAVIPARSGSKTIENKNIASIYGKPMIAFSIEQALLAEKIDRVIVSTDSEYYAEIAKEYGAEVPFIRPDNISQDTSTDIEVFQHLLLFLKEKEGSIPDICVHLRPTHPFRKISDIDKAIEMLIQNEDCDSVRSVTIAEHTPFKMWFIEKNLLRPVINGNQFGIIEAFNQPRQKLPQVYLQNANIDVIRSSVILFQNSMSGSKIIPLIQEYNYDIDEYMQYLKVKENILSIVKLNGTMCFDIDGVIATLTPGNNYSIAKPINRNIKIINWLKSKGCKIILYTARGTTTGIDWEMATQHQLEQWGVEYDELLFGKPAADLYFDDKMCDIILLGKLMEELNDE